ERSRETWVTTSVGANEAGESCGEGEKQAVVGAAADNGKATGRSARIVHGKTDRTSVDDVGDRRVAQHQQVEPRKLGIVRELRQPGRHDRDRRHQYAGEAFHLLL